MVNPDPQLITGNLILGELIGSGGVSSVYRATETPGGRIVAVKMLHPHLARDPLSRLRMKNEITLTRGLKSPYIIEIFDVHEDSENLYISMELLDGGDLKDAIMDLGAMPVAETLRVMDQILAGLDAAHQLGIVHCDIKPHNVLFASDGTVRISDFGFARSISAPGAASGAAPGKAPVEDHDPAPDFLPAGGGAGTPDYAAPELMSGGLPDPRADLYSAAVVMYEMLTGHLPFTSSSPHRTLQKHMNEPLPDIRSYDPSFSESLQLILEKAAAKLPGERYQTAAEFRESLQSMQAPVKLPAAEHAACPDCGAPLYRDFPLCLRCGYSEARIAPAAIGPAAGRSGNTASLLITGPGKRGERMSIELRHRLVEYMSRMGGGTARLEKSIPRFPFYLLKDISADNAREIGASLSELGIEARVIETADKADRSFARRAIFAKFTTLYPRILLVTMGGLGGLWGQIGNAPEVMLPLILVSLLVVIPGVSIFRFTRPQSIGADRGGSIPGPALARIAARLHQPQARSIIQRITLSLIDLKRNDDDPSRARELYRSFSEMIDELIRLDRELSRLGQGAEDAEIRSRTETTLQRYLDRLLRYSVEIDRLRLSEIELEYRGPNSEQI